MSLNLRLVQAKIAATDGQGRDAVIEFQAQLSEKNYRNEAAAWYGLAYAQLRALNPLPQHRPWLNCASSSSIRPWWKRWRHKSSCVKATLLQPKRPCGSPCSAIRRIARPPMP